MLLDTLNKILMVAFFLSCLNTIRHVYYFIQAWATSTEEVQVKYKITSKSLFLLGVSIAYILTTLFTGIKI
jgi:Sec-independent protein secretion pathway component TatC